MQLSVLSVEMHIHDTLWVTYLIGHITVSLKISRLSKASVSGKAFCLATAILGRLLGFAVQVKERGNADTVTLRDASVLTQS